MILKLAWYLLVCVVGALIYSVLPDRSPRDGGIDRRTGA